MLFIFLHRHYLPKKLWEKNAIEISIKIDSNVSNSNITMVKEKYSEFHENVYKLKEMFI